MYVCTWKGKKAIYFFFLKEITLFVLMENVLVSKEKHKCFFVPV